MEKTILITMTLEEFRKEIAEAVDKAMDARFEPLRKRFEERLLTTEEAAKALHVTIMTVYNMRERGELNPVRIGRKVMYRESEITQIINR